MAPNTLLDMLLDETGMSRKGLARRVNDLGAERGMTLAYNHSAVARWASGQIPRRRVIDLICEVLGDRLGRELAPVEAGFAPSNEQTDAPLVEFVNRAPVLWQTDHHNTQAVVRAPRIEGSAAIAPVWEWENPPHDTDVSHRGPARVEAEDIEILRAARVHYERMYQQAGGIVTRPRITRFLTEHAAPIMRGTYDHDLGRELHRAAGGLIAMAGICAYDADHQGLAQRYFHQALRMAKASGDRGFGGYVIAVMVNQAFILGDYRHALGVAEAALRTAGPHLPPSLRMDLHLTQAKCYARMGDTTSAYACMKAAQQAAAAIDRCTEPPEARYVLQSGVVENQLAETLVHVGDLAPAREYAQEAVNTSTHSRGQAQRFATLAKVDLRRGAADEAAHAAALMADAAAGMESHQLNVRLAELRNGLAALGSRSAHEAVERINVALMVRTA